MSGRELPHPLHRGLDAGYVAEGEIVPVGLRVHPGPYKAALQERPYFGGEYEPLSVIEVIERLFPEPVPGDEELVHERIVYGEGEHAFEAIEYAGATLHEAQEYRLGVGGGAECEAPGLEPTLQFPVVVYLAVEYYRVPSRALPHGLRAA